MFCRFTTIQLDSVQLYHQMLDARNVVEGDTPARGRTVVVPRVSVTRTFEGQVLYYLYPFRKSGLGFEVQPREPSERAPFVTPRTTLERVCANSTRLRHGHEKGQKIDLRIEVGMFEGLSSRTCRSKTAELALETGTIVPSVVDLP